jgi:hypothetical protein
LTGVRRCVALAGALVVLVISGCGSSSSSSSSVSAGSYVKVVCSAVRGWAQDIQTRSGALNVAKISDTHQGKTAIEGFFDAAVQDTAGVVSKLQSAGTPSVSGGDKISSALVASFNQIHTALSKGKAAASSMPTNSPTAFRNAGQKLADNVRQALAGIGAGLSGLKSAELEKAATSEPACKPLTS